jgi:hypothetical protein
VKMFSVGLAAFVAASVSMISIVVSAEEPHREHGAHVHGEAKLSLAFDQDKGQAEFKTAAEAVLGFEHPAKSAKDQKTLAKVKQTFEKEISKMISFDPKLNCQFTATKIEQVPESAQSKHSDFVANYQIQCLKSPKGSTVKIDFSRFSDLKDLDVTVLVDDLQKTAEAKGKAIQIELK